jgi:short-subunit dehydrogenase
MAGIEGRSVLITGASGAIGAEVARRLATRGARLALAARREEPLSSLANEIAASDAQPPMVLTADLGQRRQAAGLAERAVEALGGVDVLINNAGASMHGLTWVAGDGDSAREVLETNLWSPLALVSALAPQMLLRGEGVIVNVGSMIRVSPFPHLGHYAVSRSAVAMATQVLEMELSPRAIRVVEVALGPVDSPASRENRLLTGADRWLDGRPGLGEVGAAAQAIVDAADGDAQGVVFYPRVLRWPYRFPWLGRMYSRRTAKDADLLDQTLRFGGSSGDGAVQSEREQWETARRGGTR